METRCHRPETHADVDRESATLVVSLATAAITAARLRRTCSVHMNMYDGTEALSLRPGAQTVRITCPPWSGVAPDPQSQPEHFTSLLIAPPPPLIN